MFVKKWKRVGHKTKETAFFEGAEKYHFCRQASKYSLQLNQTGVFIVHLSAMRIMLNRFYTASKINKNCYQFLVACGYS